MIYPTPAPSNSAPDAILAHLQNISSRLQRIELAVASPNHTSHSGHSGTSPLSSAQSPGLAAPALPGPPTHGGDALAPDKDAPLFLLSQAVIQVERAPEPAVDPLIAKDVVSRGIVTLEQSFLMALRTAAQWDIVGSQPVVKSQNGELRFDRAL